MTSYMTHPDLKGVKAPMRGRKDIIDAHLAAGWVLHTEQQGNTQKEKEDFTVLELRKLLKEAGTQVPRGATKETLLDLYRGM